MAHTAELRLEGRTYKIITCDYEFFQHFKDNGQASGYPSGGLINLTIESPDNRDLFIHNWMQDADDHKDGKITFTVVDGGKSAIKTLRFERGYCVYLQERFSSLVDTQMLAKISISAAQISFGEGIGIVFKNDRRA